MSTNAYNIKNATVALLRANVATLGTGLNPDAGAVAVEYAMPVPFVALRCVYGGSIRFSHVEGVAEGVGLAVNEESLIPLYLRVMSRPARPAEQDDADVALILRNIMTVLKASIVPTASTRWMGLSGGLGVAGGLGGAGGAATVKTGNESVSVLGVQLRFQSRITY